ncbi:MAG: OmpA family protein [Gammaproteobacteria bacterium]|nr:OmpA family protein [Gammaproteobacteria bacterium]
MGKVVMEGDIQDRIPPATPVVPASADRQSAEAVKRLRSLILGADYESTIRRARDADETRRVAEVLAEAIRLRSQQDKGVQSALAPAIDDVLDTSIRRDPVKLARVISPIIGPSIRAAVRTALADMVESLNRILERSISPQSWWWRVQAWRAGMPFGQFVLLRTLQFRVEQVLLIHRDSGILLQAETAHGVEMRDPQLVSAMLTAIKDFVSDSFRSGNDAADLNRVRFGDRLLLIDVGPQAVIAAVVLGDPPPGLATQLSTTLEQFHRIFSQPLADFSGDRAPFQPASGLLQDCITEQIRADRTPAKPWLALSAIALVVIVAVLFGWRQWRIEQQRADIVQQLRASADYVVLGSEGDGRHLRVSLLSRFGAPSPQNAQALAQQSGIELELDMAPVAMNADDLLLPYLERRYGLGSQVSAQLQDGVLRIAGPLSAQQLEQISADSWVQGLVRTLDSTQVKIIPPPDQRALDQQHWRELVDTIQHERFYFGEDSPLLDSSEATKAVRMLEQLRELTALAKKLELQHLQILIQGYADSTGTDARNSRLSRDRALELRDFFIAHGVDPGLLTGMGVGSLGASTLTAQQKRFAMLQVIYVMPHD